MWGLSPADGRNSYRLVEGESLDTGLSAPSRIELLNGLDELNFDDRDDMSRPEFWVMGSQTWAQAVDDFCRPEKDWLTL